MKTRILLLCSLIISLLIGNINNVFATTYTWAGGSSGNWTTSSNWSPNSGYPGKTGATDIAVINTSNCTITLSSTLTIAQLKTSNYGVAGVSITLSGSSTLLTITGGISTAQPSSASTVLTFSGSGSASVAGTTTLAYNGSMAVSSGTTLTFAANAVIDLTNDQGTLSNAGTLVLSSGSNLKIGYKSALSNSGTVTANSNTFTMSGSPCSLTNSGIFNATSSTFTLTGSTIPITNSGTMTTDQCTLTASNTGSSFTNTGTYTDHGSTLSFGGQSDYFQSSTGGSTVTMHGTTINLGNGGSGNAQYIWNAGQFTVDSGANINCNAYTSYVANGGTFYAGTSNSDCAISLTAQASGVINTGTFYVGSTSIISFGGYLAYVVNGGTFTVQSDAHGSGAIGALTNSAFAWGTFNVQRYITGGSSTYRGYRLFSSPVYTSTASGNNVYTLNYIKNSALTTGSGGTGGGFDKSGNPSIYLYRENIAYSNSTYISGNYRGVANIASAPSYTMDTDGGPYYLPAGNGFLFWYRGDRTTNLVNKYTPGTSAESVTMTATGTLNTGQITVHNWYTPSSANLGYTTTTGNTLVRGDNLVGNPYPSNIDWENFQTASTTTGIYGKNIGTTIYLLDPVSKNYGAYTKGGAGIGTNNASNIIASGQGFFVTATSGTTPTLIFNETAKSTSQITGSSLLMGTSAPVNVNAGIRYIRLKMAKDSVNTEDMLVRFNSSASAAYTPDVEATYRKGFGVVSLSSFTSDHVNLAINVQPFPKTSETIPLSVNASTGGIYSLSLKNIVGIPQLYDIWLMDTWKKDSLDLRQNPTYRFNIIKSDTASFGDKRFSLVVRQNQAYAYHLINFTAAKVPGTSVRQVQLTWTTANEQNYTNFTAERSIDSGKTYTTIGSVTGSGQGEYSLMDALPADRNMYRLKSEDVNSNITYSNIIPISYSNLSNNLTAGNVSVYPNPAMSVINLNIANTLNTAGTYNIVITNSSGLVIKQASSNQVTWQTSVADFLPGGYIIKVFDPKNGAEIGNAKFVRL